MKKVLILVLLLFVLVGCSGKDEHYKPSEYQHDVAITGANSKVNDVEREILSFGTETPVDTLIITYNESIDALNSQLNKLEDTRLKLKDDSDLTNSEVRNWERSYDSAIINVENCIKYVNREKAKLYE